jgi:anti-sigma B factor antagonist
MDLTGEARSDAFYVNVDAERIDAAGAIQFKDRFRELVQDSEGRIVLDLGKVEFLDSSGLGAVVAAMKLLGSDRKLELVGLTPTVQKVFRLTRMDSVFTIHPDLASALGEADGLARA